MKLTKKGPLSINQCASIAYFHSTSASTTSANLFRLTSENAEPSHESHVQKRRSFLFLLFYFFLDSRRLIRRLDVERNPETDTNDINYCPSLQTRSLQVHDSPSS
mmetsp:Transcript_11854/g.24156  ORF Transcript_11854/g.24156 Transcript_11854/m.24156 type:complete len:105 (-) Transcript_11854:417-731(-)